MSEPFKQKIRLRTVILGLVFAVLGLLALVVSVSMAGSDHHLWEAFLREFATVALIAGSLHVAYELYQRRDYLAAQEAGLREILERAMESEDRILQRLSIAIDAQELGLTAVRRDTNTFDFGHFLEGERTLKVAVNDGRTWVSNNSGHLRRRLQDPASETTFFLIHPTSPLLEVLARRDHTTAPALAAKVNETVAMIKNLCCTDSKVRIYGHFLNNPHSVYLGDESVLITHYFHSRVRRTVPLFCFADGADGCLFKETREDLEALELDSALLFESPDARKPLHPGLQA